ncbi:hypothetical protein ACET8O_20290 [Aeromonas veronii]
MFDIDLPMDQARQQSKVVRVYDELERRLIAQFGGQSQLPVLTEAGQQKMGKDGPAFEPLIRRGWLACYLENRQAWPLLTIEAYKDKATWQGSTILHEEIINIRATLKVDMQRDMDPDTIMRMALKHMRKAMFDMEEVRQQGGIFLVTPTGEKLLTGRGLQEHETAQFTPPEPGLPYCAVHLQLSFSYTETP